MTSYQGDVKCRRHHVKRSIHKMISHGRTVTIALPNRDIFLWGASFCYHTYRSDQHVSGFDFYNIPNADPLCSRL